MNKDYCDHNFMKTHALIDYINLGKKNLDCFSRCSDFNC